MFSYFFIYHKLTQINANNHVGTEKNLCPFVVFCGLRINMLNLLKKKKPYTDESFAVYERVMAHIREPRFYSDMGVPDTFDGRFDMLVAHAFMINHVLLTKDTQKAAEFNQALFDQIFNHMHVTLREIGVGDVGIPKHQQKMMKAFNGRMHHYTQSLESDNLKAALIRNLYGTIEEPDQQEVEKFASYMNANIARLAGLEFEDILYLEELFILSHE